ncbi:hypothetical protein ABT218_20455 [Streptomyces sp. NPDC001455]|uniref:hypothetical protein n=1 Tax=unclassified Streptomyces TaxID=2593676 RepID=UPI0033186DED
MRRAVLDEVAELDLAPSLREVPFGNVDCPRDAVEEVMRRPGADRNRGGAGGVMGAGEATF